MELAYINMYIILQMFADCAHELVRGGLSSLINIYSTYCMANVIILIINNNVIFVQELKNYISLY